MQEFLNFEKVVEACRKKKKTTTNQNKTIKRINLNRRI